MKEATGELSTTVIAIVAIAAIATLFTVFLLPTLRSNIVLGQACNNGPGFNQTNDDNSKIDCDGAAGASTWKCTYTYKNGKTTSRGCKQAD